MKPSPEVCCIICQLVFCCSKCRWNHEKIAHNLLFDCSICRGSRFLCKPNELEEFFLCHLCKEHLPLQCKKCNKIFNKMEDFLNIDECITISELLNLEQNVSKYQSSFDVDKKFDSLYEKTRNNNECDNFEGIISLNKSSKTAVITPIIRKKHLVDYECSESESEDPKNESEGTPYPKLVPKTPRLKRQRAATPHTKKVLTLLRQNVVEEYDETSENVDYNGSASTNKTTPSRNENIDIKPQKEMTTPTSHLQPNILKLVQTVTTSTPTHPVSNGWSIFPEQGADSPLSEIETADSPAQSITNEPSKTETDSVPPKLKSIIVTGSRIRIGSQDSSEKHVTFQESTNNTEISSAKTKKVQFAEDTVFEPQPKINRVYRKPKRMLTPGPQKPKFCHNPRFQALINRFENKGITYARTPVQPTKEKPLESTPPVGDHTNMLARAINFKEDSPVVDQDNLSKESNELFKTCHDSPVQTNINNAITTLTANIACTLQNCLTTALKTNEDETEIQFKFVITKKKVSVKRIVDDVDGVVERSSEIERNSSPNKENIWSTVAKAVKNVFWGDQGSNLAVTTPHMSCVSNTSSSSSTSKRKCDEMSDPEQSPLNHKRHKYDGKIRCRPPLRRSKTWGVSTLRSSQSAEQHSLLKEISTCNDDVMNQSF
ncbi:uncharacterized protein LOC113514153 isoform X2 [Galleria mellonella]|uniref:Uncharacterized protein LOC113514153 isoform X2 n=1 Tax=Galleria mellonella TaxID=7137 RepID=A0ABM3MH15_GALME|nr:uncharacterized protein LOC113514153 isoform X2 [Galleria mellonella]